MTIYDNDKNSLSGGKLTDPVLVDFGKVNKSG